MSYLLYNLAIGPLIERIRTSPLKDFNTSTELSKVLVKLYADDTMIFLGPEDERTQEAVGVPRPILPGVNRRNDRKTAKNNEVVEPPIPLNRR